MGRYRKIDPRIHNDAKYKALSERGKLLFLTILTHPHMTALGSMRATEAGLCEEMAQGVSLKNADCPADCPADRAAGVLESYRNAFQGILGKGLVKFDPKNSCLVIPKFLKYNPPESPSVVTAWNAAGDLIPECHLKDELIENTRLFLKKFDKPSFLDAFKLVPNGGQADGQTDGQAAPQGAGQSVGQQEQEQEQEKDIPPLSKSSKRSAKKTKTLLPKDFGISEQVRAWAEKNGYNNLEAHLESFKDRAQAKGYKYLDWDAAFKNAIREDWGKIRDRLPETPPTRKAPKRRRECPRCNGTGTYEDSVMPDGSPAFAACNCDEVMKDA